MRRTPAGRADKQAIVWVAALLLGAGFVAVSTVMMVIACAEPVPILDQWAQLVGTRTLTFGWLVSQHNEHRLLFPRLIFIADRWLFAETGELSLAVNVLMQGALGVLLLRLGARAGLHSARLAACGAVVCGLLFWAVQYENYTWPFQVQFFGVLLAAAGCFAAVAMRPTALSAALAGGLGFVAAFTLSSGIAVPAFAVALAVWLRRPAGYVAFLAFAAAVVTGAYLVGYQTPPGHSDPVQAMMQPVALLGYAAAVLGGPFANAIGMLLGRIDPWIAEAAGAGGVGLLLVVLAMHRRTRAPQEAALLTVCGFVLATAILTALGRLRFGLPSALASRYATPALVFWGCLVLLGALRWRGRPRWGGAVVAAGLLLLIGGTQARFIHVARQVAADRRIALPALIAGVADQKIIAPIYETPDVPLQVRLTEFATRTGPFSLVWAPWIGTPLQDHTILTAGSRCDGRFDAATRIDDPAHPGWRVQGELLRPSQKRQPSVIALTDPGGRIVGYGIGDAGSTTLTVGGPAGEPPRDGWVGAIAGIAPAQARAFVLLDGDTAACPLRNEPHLESALQAGLAPVPMAAAPGGSVDAVYLGQQVTIDGWAMVQTETGTPRIELDTNLPVQSMSVAAVARPDAAAAYKDPRLARAGFRVVVMLEPGRPVPDPPRLCVWSEDAVYGTHRLTMSPATELQRRLCPG